MKKYLHARNLVKLIFVNGWCTCARWVYVPSKIKLNDIFKILVDIWPSATNNPMWQGLHNPEYTESHLNYNNNNSNNNKVVVVSGSHKTVLTRY